MDAEHLILVVDDEPGIRELLRVMLKRGRLRVETAASGEEALEIFGRTPPGAVLADVVMPGMGGVALLEELQRIDSAVPVLLMTGYGTIDTAVEAMRRGAADYITKPFKRRRLLDAVNQALARHRARAPQEGTDRVVLNAALEQRLSLRELSDRYIAHALSAFQGNKVRTARALGINRRTLYRRGSRATTSSRS